MIDEVNALRRKAGVAELKTNDLLMQVAMERAAEQKFCFGHTRPDGTGCSDAFWAISGENAGGGATAKGAVEIFAKSPGHYANMVDPRYGYAGYGWVDGVCIQIFVAEYKADIERYELDENGNPGKSYRLKDLPFTKAYSKPTKRQTFEVDPKLLKDKLHFESSFYSRYIDDTNVDYNDRFVVQTYNVGNTATPKVFLCSYELSDQYTLVLLPIFPNL